jgi:1-deoxy-D-xylulose-5-phosphate reductoisomerase
MIRLKNGAVYAQLFKPDMRLPVKDALFWPATEYSPYGELDFNSLNLSFEKCDYEKFPMLTLAYEALRGTPLLPVAYNAANETAVEAFIKKQITFLEIPRIAAYVLKQDFPRGEFPPTMETVLLLDGKARELAGEYIQAAGVENANL